MPRYEDVRKSEHIVPFIPFSLHFILLRLLTGYIERSVSSVNLCSNKSSHSIAITVKALQSQ